MFDMKNDRPRLDRLFSLRLPDDMLDALDRVAQDEDRSIADIVRRAIKFELERIAA